MGVAAMGAAYKGGKRRALYQPLLIAALRSKGATVADLSQAGGGVPENEVGYGGKNYLVEVKAVRNAESGVEGSLRNRYLSAWREWW